MASYGRPWPAMASSAAPASPALLSLPPTGLGLRPVSAHQMISEIRTDEQSHSKPRSIPWSGSRPPCGWPSPATWPTIHFGAKPESPPSQKRIPLFHRRIRQRQRPQPWPRWPPPPPPPWPWLRPPPRPWLRHAAAALSRSHGRARRRGCGRGCGSGRCHGRSRMFL